MIGESLDVDADRVIDAGGKYVLPGCVDPHTHLDMPFGGTVKQSTMSRPGRRLPRSAAPRVTSTS